MFCRSEAAHNKKLTADISSEIEAVFNLMNVHIRIPYSLTKNIGQQYNAEFSTCPDGDALAFQDGDIMHLVPNFGHILHEYANAYPNAVLTCYTNRTHNLSTEQQSLCRSEDVATCIKYAMYISNDRTITQVHGTVSMLLMVIPKSVWLLHQFTEHNMYRPQETNMLAVDNEFTNRIRKAGVPVLRMNGLMVYHQYRLLTGSKEHLL